jgi:PAS domain S-box-containing protein
MANFKKRANEGSASVLQNLQQLRRIIETIPEALVVIETTGKITDSNHAALELFDADELNGKTLAAIADFIDAAGRPVDLQKNVLLSENGFTSRQWSLRAKDGLVIDLGVDSSPLVPVGGPKDSAGFVVLFSDITADKLAEREQAELANMASQELRTPVSVAGISLKNAMLLGERTNSPDPIKHSLVAAGEQLEFLSNLVNDLAMLSRSSSSGMIPVIETFNPSDLLDSLVTEYQTAAAKKRLTLQTQVSANPGLITSNQAYVRQILRSLILNAINYTEKGGISLLAAKTKTGVELSVVDTGIGIDASEQAKLFDKFYRGQDYRVREQAGAGLGLYVAAKLARQLDATLKIESRPDHGSSFKLSLPNLQTAP